MVESDFICERISSSWLGGSVLSVREIASVAVTPGGKSFPGGRGGSDPAGAVWVVVWEAPLGWPIAIDEVLASSPSTRPSVL